MSEIEQARNSDQSKNRGSWSRYWSIWLFPYCVAALAYFAGAFYESAGALHATVLAWPVPQDIYAWLLLMLVLAGAWLVAEFISVTNRETIVAALQWDSVHSSLTAIIFTGAAGWFIGTGTLQRRLTSCLGLPLLSMR